MIAVRVKPPLQISVRVIAVQVKPPLQISVRMIAARTKIKVLKISKPRTIVRMTAVRIKTKLFKSPKLRIIVTMIAVGMRSRLIQSPNAPILVVTFAAQLKLYLPELSGCWILVTLAAVQLLQPRTAFRSLQLAGDLRLNTLMIAVHPRTHQRASAVQRVMRRNSKQRHNNYCRYAAGCAGCQLWQNAVRWPVVYPRVV
jgi:hypothetical protein